MNRLKFFISFIIFSCQFNPTEKQKDDPRNMLLELDSMVQESNPGDNGMKQMIEIYDSISLHPDRKK